MKKQFVLIVILILLVSIRLSGCNQVKNTSHPERNIFIGSWNGTYSWGINLSRTVFATITFHTDGTYSAILPLMTDNGTWDIKDGKFEKTMHSQPTIEYSYSFNHDNTSLLLTSSSQDEQWNLSKL